MSQVAVWVVLAYPWDASQSIGCVTGEIPEIAGAQVGQFRTSRNGGDAMNTKFRSPSVCFSERLRILGDSRKSTVKPTISCFCSLPG